MTDRLTRRAAGGDSDKRQQKKTPAIPCAVAAPGTQALKGLRDESITRR